MVKTHAAVRGITEGELVWEALCQLGLDAQMPGSYNQSAPRGFIHPAGAGGEGASSLVPATASAAEYHTSQLAGTSSAVGAGPPPAPRSDPEE